MYFSKGFLIDYINSTNSSQIIIFSIFSTETLESLERGEMKFTCSYDEADNFGDSCGSAESEEGSDSEPENNQNSELDFVEISAIKAEPEGDDITDYDVEVRFIYLNFHKTSALVPKLIP